jgi:hypothetical protein
MEDIDEALAHYGVKGMKWGVHRLGGSSSSSEKPAPHEDALRANTYKTRAKKGGPDALSNAELQALVSRMNLEKQYSSLSPPTGAQKTGKFIAELLVNAGKQQAAKLVNDQATKHVARLLAKK